MEPTKFYIKQQTHHSHVHIFIHLFFLKKKKTKEEEKKYKMLNGEKKNLPMIPEFYFQFCFFF